MNENVIVRRATMDDIDFLVDSIVAAEKSGTDNFGLAKLFELSENEMRYHIKAMLDEEIDGCEFSVSSFLVAEVQGKVVSAFAGWVEGQNDDEFDDELPSSIIKSNLISYCLPIENIKCSKNKSDIVRPLQIERDKGAYQLEYSYTLKEYRGKGVLGLIMDAHEQEAIVKGVKKMQVHVFDNNSSAIKSYEKNGFRVKRRFESDNDLTTSYFPSKIELLLEKEL